jgi:hypothetical protein
MKFGIMILVKYAVRYEGNTLPVGISQYITKEVKDFYMPVDFSSVVVDPGCLSRIPDPDFLSIPYSRSNNSNKKKGGDTVFYTAKTNI